MNWKSLATFKLPTLTSLYMFFFYCFPYSTWRSCHFFSNAIFSDFAWSYFIFEVERSRSENSIMKVVCRASCPYNWWKFWDVPLGQCYSKSLSNKDYTREITLIREFILSPGFTLCHSNKRTGIGQIFLVCACPRKRNVSENSLSKKYHQQVVFFVNHNDRQLWLSKLEIPFFLRG